MTIVLICLLITAIPLICLHTATSVLHLWILAFTCGIFSVRLLTIPTVKLRLLTCHLLIVRDFDTSGSNPVAWIGWIRWTCSLSWPFLPTVNSKRFLVDLSRCWWWRPELFILRSFFSNVMSVCPFDSFCLKFLALFEQLFLSLFELFFIDETVYLDRGRTHSCLGT